MALDPASTQIQHTAAGDLSGLTAVLQKAFAIDAAEFQPIPKPSPGDWLSVHNELGQTFQEFVRSQPPQERRIIYLQLVGEFPPERSPSIAKLREFATAFFAMEVKVLPALTGNTANFTTRRNPITGNSQLLTSDILHLLKTRLPPDAFCILAITMEDLYPEATWNFVFGQASLRERVGVYSFARYDPAFYGEARAPEYERLLLRRSCKVLAHETGHMFGLAHCTFFNCLMNGSNHLAESDRRPLHLCPLCLRKLQWSIGFDVVNRYRSLQRINRAAGFADEADWLGRRIEILGVQ